jgi:hypothetical protein
VMMTSPILRPTLPLKMHPYLDQDCRAGHAVMSILGAAAFRETASRVQRTIEQHLPEAVSIAPVNPLTPNLGGDCGVGEHPQTPGSILLHLSGHSSRSGNPDVLAASMSRWEHSTPLIPHSWGTMSNAEGLRPSAHPMATRAFNTRRSSSRRPDSILFRPEDLAIPAPRQHPPSRALPVSLSSACR